MSINLIESEHASQRSLGGTFVSIALHASLITLAVYATANAGSVSVKVPMDSVTVFYPPQPKEPRHPTHGPPAHPNTPSTPAFPREPVPGLVIEIPDKLPSIDSSIGAVPSGESLRRSCRSRLREGRGWIANGVRFRRADARIASR